MSPQMEVKDAEAPGRPMKENRRRLRLKNGHEFPVEV